MDTNTSFLRGFMQTGTFIRRGLLVMGRSKFLAVLAGLLFLSSAHAQLDVDTSILELSNQTGRAIIRLSNSGTDTLYVNLNLHEVLNPEAKDPNKQLLSDPANDGILVHPRQLILEPGEHRSAKVVLTQRIENKDRIFRLHLEPLAGEALPVENEQRSNGVRILLGYQILVLARPDDLKPDVHLQREEKQIVFHNKGNTSVLLRKLSVCKSNDNDCSDLPPNRLYPNEILTVELPPGTNGKSAHIRSNQSVQYKEELVEYEM